MEQPLLFADFMLKAECKRFLEARGKLWQLPLQERPVHPSWKVGKLFAQGRLMITIQTTGYIAGRFTNPRKV